MRPRVIARADAHDAMRDQMEYLIDHVESQRCLGCDDCTQYVDVKRRLLGIFGQPPPKRLMLRVTCGNV